MVSQLTDASVQQAGVRLQVAEQVIMNTHLAQHVQQPDGGQRLLQAKGNKSLSRAEWSGCYQYLWENETSL